MDTDNSNLRVTRSLRKRLLSNTDSDANSRPSTPINNDEKGKEDTPSRRMTRRQSINTTNINENGTPSNRATGKQAMGSNSDLKTINESTPSKRITRRLSTNSNNELKTIPGSDTPSKRVTRRLSVCSGATPKSVIQSEVLTPSRRSSRLLKQPGLIQEEGAESILEVDETQDNNEKANKSKDVVESSPSADKKPSTISIKEREAISVDIPSPELTERQNKETVEPEKEIQNTQKNGDSHTKQLDSCIEEHSPTIQNNQPEEIDDSKAAEQSKPLISHFVEPKQFVEKTNSTEVEMLEADIENQQETASSKANEDMVDIASSASDLPSPKITNSSPNKLTASTKNSAKEKEITPDSNMDESNVTFPTSWTCNIAGVGKIDTFESENHIANAKEHSKYYEVKQPSSATKKTPKKPFIMDGTDESGSEEDMEQEDDIKTMFIDDEAMEVPDGEESMDSEERAYLEQNEIPIDGESIGSVDTDTSTSFAEHDEEEEDDDDDDDGGFIVSDSESIQFNYNTDSDDEIEIKPKKKRRSRILLPEDSSSEEKTVTTKPKTASTRVMSDDSNIDEAGNDDEGSQDETENHEKVVNTKVEKDIENKTEDDMDSLNTSKKTRGIRRRINSTSGSDKSNTSLSKNISLPSNTNRHSTGNLGSRDEKKERKHVKAIDKTLSNENYSDFKKDRTEQKEEISPSRKTKTDSNNSSKSRARDNSSVSNKSGSSSFLETSPKDSDAVSAEDLSSSTESKVDKKDQLKDLNAGDDNNQEHSSNNVIQPKSRSKKTQKREDNSELDSDNEILQNKGRRQSRRSLKSSLSNKASSAHQKTPTRLKNTSDNLENSKQKTNMESDVQASGSDKDAEKYRNDSEDGDDDSVQDIEQEVDAKTILLDEGVTTSRENSDNTGKDPKSAVKRKRFLRSLGSSEDRNMETDVQASNKDTKKYTNDLEDGDDDSVQDMKHKIEAKTVLLDEEDTTGREDSDDTGKNTKRAVKRKRFSGSLKNSEDRDMKTDAQTTSSKKRHKHAVTKRSSDFSTFEDGDDDSVENTGQGNDVQTMTSDKKKSSGKKELKNSGKRTTIQDTSLKRKLFSENLEDSSEQDTPKIKTRSSKKVENKSLSKDNIDVSFSGRNLEAGAGKSDVENGTLNAKENSSDSEKFVEKIPENSERVDDKSVDNLEERFGHSDSASKNNSFNANAEREVCEEEDNIMQSNKIPNECDMGVEKNAVVNKQRQRSISPSSNKSTESSLDSRKNDIHNLNSESNSTIGIENHSASIINSGSKREKRRSRIESVNLSISKKDNPIIQKCEILMNDAKENDCKHLKKLSTSPLEDSSKGPDLKNDVVECLGRQSENVNNSFVVTLNTSVMLKLKHSGAIDTDNGQENLHLEEKSSADNCYEKRFSKTKNDREIQNELSVNNVNGTKSKTNPPHNELNGSTSLNVDDDHAAIQLIGQFKSKKSITLQKSETKMSRSAEFDQKENNKHIREVPLADSCNEGSFETEDHRQIQKGYSINSPSSTKSKTYDSSNSGLNHSRKSITTQKSDISWSEITDIDHDKNNKHIGEMPSTDKCDRQSSSETENQNDTSVNSLNGAESETNQYLGEENEATSDDAHTQLKRKPAKSISSKKAEVKKSKTAEIDEEAKTLGKVIPAGNRNEVSFSETESPLKVQKDNSITKSSKSNKIQRQSESTGSGDDESTISLPSTKPSKRRSKNLISLQKTEIKKLETADGDEEAKTLEEVIPASNRNEGSFSETESPLKVQKDNSITKSLKSNKTQRQSESNGSGDDENTASLPSKRRSKNFLSPQKSEIKKLETAEVDEEAKTLGKVIAAGKRNEGFFSKTESPLKVQKDNSITKSSKSNKTQRQSESTGSGDDESTTSLPSTKPSKRRSKNFLSPQKSEIKKLETAEVDEEAKTLGKVITAGKHNGGSLSETESPLKVQKDNSITKSLKSNKSKRQIESNGSGDDESTTLLPSKRRSKNLISSQKTEIKKLETAEVDEEAKTLGKVIPAGNRNEGSLSETESPLKVQKDNSITKAKKSKSTKTDEENKYLEVLPTDKCVNRSFSETKIHQRSKLKTKQFQSESHGSNDDEMDETTIAQSETKLAKHKSKNSITSPENKLKKASEISSVEKHNEDSFSDPKIRYEIRQENSNTFTKTVKSKTNQCHNESHESDIDETENALRITKTRKRKSKNLISPQRTDVKKLRTMESDEESKSLEEVFPTEIHHKIHTEKGTKKPKDAKPNKNKSYNESNKNDESDSTLQSVTPNSVSHIIQNKNALTLHHMETESPLCNNYEIEDCEIKNTSLTKKKSKKNRTNPGVYETLKTTGNELEEKISSDSVGKSKQIPSVKRQNVANSPRKILERCEEILGRINHDKLESKLKSKLNQETKPKKKKKKQEALEIPPPVESIRKEKIQKLTVKTIHSSKPIAVCKEHKVQNLVRSEVNKAKENKKLKDEALPSISNIPRPKHKQIEKLQPNKENATKLKREKLTGVHAIREVIETPCGMVIVEPVAPKPVKQRHNDREAVSGGLLNIKQKKADRLLCKDLLTKPKSHVSHPKEHQKAVKRQNHTEEPHRFLPKTQWTSSGVFIEEDIAVPISTVNSGGTQFVVKSLPNTKKVKTAPKVLSMTTMNKALAFKHNSLFNNQIVRESSYDVVQRKKRKLVSSQL